MVGWYGVILTKPMLADWSCRWQPSNRNEMDRYVTHWFAVAAAPLLCHNL